MIDITGWAYNGLRPSVQPHCLIVRCVWVSASSPQQVSRVSMPSVGASKPVTPHGRCTMALLNTCTSPATVIRPMTPTSNVHGALVGHEKQARKQASLV